MGLFWVPGHAGIRGNEIADGLARGGTALRFLGTEPALWVYRRDLQKRLGRWLANQHGANGEILVIHKGRLECLSRDLVGVPGQN